MNRVVSGLVVLLLGCLFVSPALAQRYALPPHAEGVVATMLRVHEPVEHPSAGPVWLSATIAHDQVQVEARVKGGAVLMALTLWHPEAAPPGGQRVGGTVLVPRGDGDARLRDEVIRRLRANPTRLPWIVAEGRAREVDGPAVAFDSARVDALLERGATSEARDHLRGAAVPTTSMGIAALALRWRLAGDPARAMALIDGVQGEAHERLALSVARGEGVTTEEVLRALPAGPPCEAVGLARLLRMDRAYPQAAAFAEAIRAREPGCLAAHHEAVVGLELAGQREAADHALRVAKEQFPSAIEIAAAESFLRMRRGDIPGAWRIKVRLFVRRLMSADTSAAGREMLSWFAASLRGALGAVARVVSRPATPVDAGVWCPDVGSRRCLRRVKGGTFRMGAQADSPGAPGYDPDAATDEAPPRLVTIPTLYAMQTEVSVREYVQCVGAGACRLSDVTATGGYFNYGQVHRQDHPMNGVSWFGAQRYCAWMGGRLPTEAEWEFLARGFDERRFPWGDGPPECDVTGSRWAPQGCPSDGTQPPGVYAMPSAAGLSAMGGGVWEWVADWYGPYPALPSYAPRGPERGEARVQRGGAWSTDDPLERRASVRASLAPSDRMSDVGFRCVRSGSR